MIGQAYQRLVFAAIDLIALAVGSGHTVAVNGSMDGRSDGRQSGNPLGKLRFRGNSVNVTGWLTRVSTSSGLIRSNTCVALPTMAVLPFK
jgi:hypothetical protein